MSHKRMICIFITLCMLISFTGCLNRTSDNAREIPESENINSSVDMMVGDTNLEEWHENKAITDVNWPKPSLPDEPQVLDDSEVGYQDSDDRTQYANVFDFDSLDTQPMFAVAFLGYGDRMEFRHTYVEGIFTDLDDFAIEQVGHIDYEGDEWYLIVPRYQEDVDITNLDTGEVHTIYNGEAFTVKCNLSDLHSNIEISTAIGLGGHIFSPQIGGDGKLVPNPDVWDITDYSVMDENLYIQEGE